MSDPVKAPAHYRWIENHECRDIARHMSFNVGSAIKYCYRHLHKGRPVEDLRKAVECLTDEIARLEANDLSTKKGRSDFGASRRASRIPGTSSATSTGRRARPCARALAVGGRMSTAPRPALPTEPARPSARAPGAARA